MLLINRTLLRLAKGLWGWIFTIFLLKMIVLAGTTSFAQTVAGYLGKIHTLSVTPQETKAAIISAFFAAIIMLLSELLIGEAEFRCTAKARQNLRKKIFSKVLELDVGNVEKIGPVSAVTSSVDGVEAMQVYYSKYLPGLFYCFCAPFYLFLQLRSVSYPTAVFLLVVSLVLMPVNNIFRKKLNLTKNAYWNSMEDLTGYYLESVQGLTTIKLYGQDDLRTEKLREKADHFNRRVMDMMKLNFSSFLVTDGLIYLSIVLAVVIVCQQLSAGTIALPAALTVLMLSFGFFGSVRQLMNTAHSALAGISASDKVEKILQIDTSRPYDPSQPKEGNGFSGIRIQNLSFSYEGRNTALKDITMEIPKGKTTALVGLSGCGKSTVAALLMRFYDPASGKILLEGQDYTALTPDELRHHIIMVPQTVSLFSGTIRENLLIAAPHADDAELLDALKQVRLLDWVTAQPRGLDTDVGDAGAKLSGGQRQKMGIARALLCRAEYIIFDESTSSVDMESEREIWNCIGELALTRTLIIISHRLSTIQNADNIYVLEKGIISQHGNHQQLIKQDGLYRRLVEEQAELERQGEEVLSHE